MNVDRKRTEEGKIKTNVLVPNKSEKEGERGLHLPFLSGQLRAGRTGSVLPWKPSNLQRESPINYHKCPTFDAGDFQSQLIDK